jgi:hypothetical protein
LFFFFSINIFIYKFKGSIIGGIIGTDVVKYDVYGKDITLANKMESNGYAGKVMMSEFTKKWVENEICYNIEFAKDLEVKEKNEAKIIKCYYISKNIQELKNK